jgi:transcriptional regulator with XRE-family HTH domain
MTENMALEDLEHLSAVRRWAESGVARTVRERAKITQAELAAVCGVDPSAVGLWERGERTPGGETAKKYYSVLVKLASHFPGGIDAIEKKAKS